MSRRFFKHGELPLVLLALLAEQPRHGYDVMAALTRLFGPRYRASPGTVYPAIEALEAEGLIEGRAEGDRTVYRIKPSGEAALRERAELLATLELRVGVRIAPGESLDTLLTRFKARLAPLSGHVDPAAATEVLERAASEIEALQSTPNRKRRTQHAR
jgi:DNA-binding PadR family transcriptional regulator